MIKIPYRVPGVDISYWNTADVDSDKQIVHKWEAFDTSRKGIRFVGIRIGRPYVSSSIEEGTWMDKHFLQNVGSAYFNSIPWYGYWRLDNPWLFSASEQVELMLTAYLETSSYTTAPLILDLEEFDKGRTWPKDQLSMYISDVFNSLQQLGVTFAVYTNDNWWDNSVNPHRINTTNIQLNLPQYIRVDGKLSKVPMDPNWWNRFEFNLRKSYGIPLGFSDPVMVQFAAEGSSVGKHLGFTSEHVDCQLMQPSTFKEWWPNAL